MLVLEELEVGFDGFRAGPVSTRIDTGIVHLAGPNGTGKTTLLRTLCGELPARSGSVRIDGRDPFSDHRARAPISLVPARSELPGFLTVGEAWRTAAGLRGAEAWDGTKVAEALELPESLRISTGSAGQRQKAELLCALVGDPPVLLLDETLAHLDVGAVDTVLRWIDAWRSSRTIVVAQHAPLALPHRTITFAPSGEQGGIRRVRIDAVADGNSAHE